MSSAGNVFMQNNSVIVIPQMEDLVPLADRKMTVFDLRWAERIGPLSSTPSTTDVSSLLVQLQLVQLQLVQLQLVQLPRDAMRLLPSNIPPPNLGLIQCECVRMKPLLCAKQSSRGIDKKIGINKNIGVNVNYRGRQKYRRLQKYRHQQNIGVNKNIGINKIKESTKYRHRQNIGVDKI
jgi:hypothetical protein